MNLSNKLTLFRIILVPVFVIFMLLPVGPQTWFSLIALLVFVVASVTDLADGRIARKRNLISNFGKLMDPLADKLLVCSALLCLMALGLIPVWIVIVIIAREFVVSGFRLIAAEQQRVIAAGIWGKWKTVFQMAAVILLLVFRFGDLLLEQLAVTGGWLVFIEIILLIGLIAIYVAVVLTVISLIDYIVRNRDVMRPRDETGGDDTHEDHRR